MPRVAVVVVSVALVVLPALAWAHTGTLPGSAPGAMTQDSARGRAARGARRAGRAEPHPAIRAAVRNLERARGELEHASHDFGGHRAEALRAVDEAVKQLRLALQYDKQ